MLIAITGSSGLIGRAVSDRLRADGHRVTRVVRSREAARQADAFYWSPATGEVDAAGLAGHDAVINLAGENIAGVWTRAKKRRIRDSRVEGTRLLAETVAGLEPSRRPRVWINASAVGYYGRDAGEPLREDAPPGDTFMAAVVRDWEAATEPARGAGVRVVCTRFGLVLDPDALLLQALSIAGRLGLAAAIGDGSQPFPWVTLDEIATLMPFLLDHDALDGPVNVAGRDKVTNAQFVDTLARVLRRPRFLRVPPFAMRLLGELGYHLLAGAWMDTTKLAAAGYAWRDPELEPALRRLL